MKILLIDAHTALLTDFAVRCVAAGHEVRWFIRKNPFTREVSQVGRGLVPRIAEYESSMKWADMIVQGDSAIFTRQLDVYRKQGYPIFGPTSRTAEWEMDREKGQQVFEGAGIAPIPSVTFNDYDSAIAYVKKHMKRFVSKPSGDADKSLSYCSKSPKDMVYMLERWKKLGTLKDPFILQEFIPGIEMAVGGWFGGGKFNPSVCENWEFKKLMPGDKGPACYDSETEVLTVGGWKPWPQVTMQDQLATLVNGALEFEYPTKVVHAEVEGELIGWKGKGVDILVTPGHSMYVQDSKGRKPFFFEPAEVTATKKRKLLRAFGDWKGTDTKEQLPRFVTCSTAAFARLLGFYMADGSCHSSGRSLVFGNCPEHKRAKVKDFALAAGFTAKVYGNDVYVNSVDMCRYVRQFGKALDKFVPAFVKEGTRSIIAAFLEGYLTGDGSLNGVSVACTTVSKRLAGDLQELFIKFGTPANINSRDRSDEGHSINGAWCQSSNLIYDISVAHEKKRFNLTPSMVYTQPYKGTVHCATVSTHILLVRRNGKACWLGNTGEMGTVVKYTDSSLLADEVLFPLTPYLAYENYVGYVDVNCIIDAQGTPHPLEFTMRFGYPISDIQRRLHKNADPAQWMFDLMEGKHTLKTSDQVATGVVVAIPDFPYSHLTRKEVSNIPIYGITEKNQDSVHLGSVMKGTYPDERNGKIVTSTGIVTAGDYVLVCSGTGDTVKASAERAYKTVKEIEIPNSPFCRDDIGERLEKQLPELHKMGYATGIDYE